MADNIKVTITGNPPLVVSGVTQGVAANVLPAFNQANSAFSQANSANSQASAAFNQANGAWSAANTGIAIATQSGNQANSAFVEANVANTISVQSGNIANVAFSTANAAYSSSNTSNTIAIQSGNQANSAFVGANIANLIAIQSGTVANSAFAAANTANIIAIQSGNQANSAYIQANTSNSTNGFGYIAANAAFAQANSSWTTANTSNIIAIQSGNQVNSSFSAANTANARAIGAFAQANGAWNSANTANNIALQSGNQSNSAFSAANTANSIAIQSGNQANSAFVAANTANTIAIQSGSQANSAFTGANTANSIAMGAFSQANSAWTTANTANTIGIQSGNQANSAFSQANTANATTGLGYIWANSAFNQANGAFARANAAYAQANTSPGSNTNIIFNDSGVYAGSNNTSWNKANSSLLISGNTYTTEIVVGDNVAWSKIPSWKYDFRSEVLPFGSTFTRNSIATYYAANGQMMTVSANVARFDHNPIDGLPFGYLAEVQSTNAVTYSADRTHWTVSITTLSTDGTLAPDGSLATLVTANSGAGKHYVASGQASGAGSTLLGLSIFVKQGSTRYVCLAETQDSINHAGTFDFQTGVFVNAGQGISNPTARQLANGWWRLSFQMTATSTSTTTQLSVSPTTSSTGTAADNTYTAIGNETVYVFGFQNEANGVGTTTYIPTAGSAVTRLSDVLTLPLTSLPGWSSSIGGMLVCTYRLHSRARTGVVSSIVDSGAGANAVLLYEYFGGAAFSRFNTFASGNIAQLGGPASPAQFVRRKISVAWMVGRQQIAHDGILDATNGGQSTALPSSLVNLRIGTDDGTNSLCGTIESIAYYMGNKTDNEVQFTSANGTVLGSTVTYLHDQLEIIGSTAQSAFSLANSMSVAANTARINIQTANYTVSNTDSGSIIVMNSSSNLNVTVPFLSTGMFVRIIRGGSGTVNIQNTNIVMNSTNTGNTLITKQYASVTLLVWNANTVILDGSV